MRKGFQAFPILGLLALTGLAVPAQQKPDPKPAPPTKAAADKPAVETKAPADNGLLSYKAQKGQLMRYKSAATLTLEGNGIKGTSEIKDTTKVTVSSVAANGNITFEHETEDSEYYFNGQKSPGSDSDKSKETITIAPDGTLVSFTSTENDKDQVKLQARLFVASSPILPVKAVKVGDKWTHEFKGNGDLGLRAAKADFEVLGREKKGDVDTFKIKMAYKETEGSPALAVTGVWAVEANSGDMVTADYEVANLVLGEGGPTANGKIHEERTGGSPVGGVKPISDKPEPKKEKTIDETVKDFDKLPGQFTLYRKKDKDSGRETIYLELKDNQLDKYALMQVTASTGTAGAIVAGDPIDDILFKFVRQDDKILFIKPNFAYQADPKSPIARAVKRSFADAILDSYKIEATQPDRKSVLINVSELFKGDIAQLSLAVGGYMMDREKTYVATIKNFPENLAIETAYHFVRGMSRPTGLAALLGGGGDTLADSRSMPLRVYYNVFLLPENNYKPRIADARVGYFLTEYQDFTKDDKVDDTVRYIYRWNLEKADPKAALSPPKKPIVFWLDNAMPTEYRDAVKEGLLRWNKAFEKVGYKDAIVINQMPDNADWDHADMRYNTIRWVTSPANGYAVALFRVNPLTGQILNASITVDANMTKFLKEEHRMYIDPSTYFQEQPAFNKKSIDPRYCRMAQGAIEQAWFGHMALSMLAPPGVKIDDVNYVRQFLADVVCHEMGHIMGLRHNFIASTYHDDKELADGGITKETGITASVMDYTPFNVYALKKPGTDYYSKTIGPYDIWAIEYGYTNTGASTPEGELPKLKEIASKDNLPGHAYQSDEIADTFDPEVTRFDLGKDPLAYWSRMIQVTRYLLLNLDTRQPKYGDSYWDFTRNFNSLMNMYVRSTAIASRFVGGTFVNRNFRGDPYEKPTIKAVDVKAQREALSLLNTYIFSEGSFTFPKRYFSKMTGDPFGGMDIAGYLGGISSQEFPIRDSLAGVQRSALQRVFGSIVLRRIVNNEFKASDPKNALTLPTLFNSVHGAVWSELVAQKNIDTLRRQLQRAYLDTMITMVISPASGTPEDAKMLAWDQLNQLKAQIGRASARKDYDDYTRIHLAEMLMRVNRTLDARQVISTASASSSTSLLQLLLGGSTAPQAAQSQGMPANVNGQILQPEATVPQN